MLKQLVPLILLICSGIELSFGQLYGSNFLSAMRGYAGDTCRFIFCPVGEVCVNGVCNGGALMGNYYGGGLAGNYGYGGGLAGNYGYGAATGLGLLGGANKLCAETVDCYSGQICQAGRCTFTSGFGAYSGALGAYPGTLGVGGYGGALGGYPGGALGGTLGGTLGGYPLGAGGFNSLSGAGVYNRGASFPDRPSGIQMCSIIQDCPNSQICVNGYCSQSNVVYGGSQALRSLSTCATGAVCPVAHVCLAGTCVPNHFSKTSPCLTSATCSFGAYCQAGRCLPTGPYFK